MPHELSAFGVFFSPWLAAWAGACLIVPLCSRLLRGLSFRTRQWDSLSLLVLAACILFRWGI
ncbi:MAG: hypothetical protein IJZ18_04925 [Mailhella sp.]|nr:hypothetical protein [Mailhella sp.]